MIDSARLSPRITQYTPILGLLLLSLMLGAGVQMLLPVGGYLAGWLAGAILFFLAGLLMWGLWRLAGGGKALAGMVVLAFALRVGLGVSLAFLLPGNGYPQPEQQAGYAAKDAYHRDMQAWHLAQSGKPVWQAFTDPQYSSDQYGGMLAMSALVYRTVSPDAHRPYLISIITAMAAACGIPFFWSAVRRRWGAVTATIGSWIMVAYPESVFWGSAQMREPILITLITMAFWGILRRKDRKQLAWIVLIVSSLGLFMFSTTVALAVVGVLVGWIWLDDYPEKASRLWKAIGWMGLVTVIIVLIVMTWTWLHASARYDIALTGQNSGQLQYILDHLGRQWQAPLIILYGIFRPVLPGAIFDPAPWIWQATWIWRALGWSLLAPLLLYAMWIVLRIPTIKERRQWIWLTSTVWIWILIASARAGGGASDNPRYRVIFIFWMALLAGQAWMWASKYGYRWLWRLLAVEGVFQAVMTSWYAARYLHLWPVPSFTQLGFAIGSLSIAILGGSWLWDNTKSRIQTSRGLEKNK